MSEDFKKQYLISLLYSLEDYSGSKKEIDKKYPLDLSQEEARLLLDYITNLQQRIDKAIEYIEKHKRKDGFLNLNEWQTRNLLDILRGDE